MSGPGKAFDPTTYFIIATDAIGNGLITSSGNSETQHGRTCPHFTIPDMVGSQRRVVVEHVGIKRVVAERAHEPSVGLACRSDVTTGTD